MVATLSKKVDQVKLSRLGSYARYAVTHPEAVGAAFSWRATSWRLRHGLFTLPVVAGSRPIRSDVAVAVVMCLWNRPSRIDEILRQLDEQESPRSIRLVLWNNNWADRERYSRAISGYECSGSLGSVELHSSRVNMGGLARFLVARKLARRGYSGTFIMLDDDQNLTPDVVTTLLDAAAPHRINGWWAFNHLSSYWDRVPVADGQRADHVGTGGSAVDISLVADDAFFTRLPRKYAFLEDQWMCWYGRSLGWSLLKTEVGITAVMEDSNQYHALVPLKDEFWRYLGAQ